MRQRLLGRARLRLRPHPRGPLLVKSGRETPDPARPGLELVRPRPARLANRTERRTPGNLDRRTGRAAVGKLFERLSSLPRAASFSVLSRRSRA